MSKTLILTVWLPRSGKTTWSHQQETPVVNPDAMRLAIYNSAFVLEAETLVWTHVEYMLKALFLAGHEKVILDATNITEEKRYKWRQFAAKIWVWIKFKCFHTDLHECKERAKKCWTEYLIPVIDRMARDINYPEEWEMIVNV